MRNGNLMDTEIETTTLKTNLSQTKTTGKRKPRPKGKANGTRTHLKHSETQIEER